MDYGQTYVPRMLDWRADEGHYFLFCILGNRKCDNFYTCKVSDSELELWLIFFFFFFFFYFSRFSL